MARCLRYFYFVIFYIYCKVYGIFIWIFLSLHQHQLYFPAHVSISKCCNLFDLLLCFLDLLGCSSRWCFLCCFKFFMLIFCLFCADNLLLTANRKKLKLTDFGLAREETVTEMMTAETGTYRWMAPEVVNTIFCINLKLVKLHTETKTTTYLLLQ